MSLLTPWWIIRPAYQPSTPLSSLPEGAVPLNITAMRLEGTFPTQYWWAGDKLLDTAQLTLPSDPPPGNYQLLLGLYDLSNGQRFVGADGQSTWQVGELSWDGERWR